MREEGDSPLAVDGPDENVGAFNDGCYLLLRLGELGANLWGVGSE